MTVRRITIAFMLAILVTAAPHAFAQCVSLTTMGSASTQDFNTLSSTAGSTTNNLTITGWFMTEGGGGARDNEQYAVDTGGSATGDTYSYGAAGNSERALGALRSGTLDPLFGACFTNNTGSTITSLDVAYTGEQWRLGTTARTDAFDFQLSTNATALNTGTWTSTAALGFVTPDTGTTGPKDGNSAANRTALSSAIAVSIANGATFWIRWVDLDVSGADDGLAVDDFSLTPQAAPATPVLSITDVTLAEGDAGTTTFTFAVNLSAPAQPGGVTFDIATADGTAEDDNPVAEDEDYVANSLTGQTIPAGSSGPYDFSVTVNGDTEIEPNETFFVNVTNITGANAGDTQGQGTINNDDVTLTPIHDVQGPGSTSPITGATVTIRGIVTGVKSNGFFVQEPDATVDADPSTSEGIFVYTNAAPPAAAAFTSRVQVTGTVAEFVPPSDPQQPRLTELTSPAVVQLAPAGQTLPTAVPLSATFPDPAGPFDQLERVEGMRVSAASITVTGPSDGSINEANNTGTSNGRFHGVITGVPRPFREPGIQAPDVPPVGTIPPIPRWDTNPERLRIESATINGQPILTVKSGDVVGPVTGPLDYGFRGYAIYPDGTSSVTVTPGTLETAVTTPTAQEFTVASFNMFHFYDTTDDPEGDVALSPVAFADRLNKASIAIRNHLQFPDILGVQEMENLTTLQDLATKISTDAIANAQPDPMYVAYLSEGNDVGGIDVGYLVKTAPVPGGSPRVEVNSVTQVGASETWIDPDDGNAALLHDRPPLVLEATIHRGPGASFPIVVVNNHLRSLIAIDSIAPDGLTTEGDRVRRKRQTQADRLAAYIQSRLTATPGEHIVLVGDFNAFEFNDGYADVINTITGTPPPDAETVVCSTCPGLPNTFDGTDQVNPDLVNLVSTPSPAERYSYIHDGNAQNIDHAIVSAGLVADTLARRIEHPRISSDYPETERANNGTALRISDHDPIVAFFSAAALASADLSVTKSDTPDPVAAGQNLTYTVTMTNNGPDEASSASWTDTLPAGTTFVSLSLPAGWTCTTPAVGAGGTVSCSIASFAVTSASFTLTVATDPALANNTVLTNTATVTSLTADAAPGNEMATATTTVQALADLSLTKTDSPDSVDAGSNIAYTITVANAGPSHAVSVALSDTLPAGTTFVSLSSPPGWTCTTPAVGANGTVSCSIASFAVTTAPFTLTVATDPALANDTVLTNTAAVTSTTTDPAPGNETATATTTVQALADLTLTKTDSPDPVNAGSSLTYTITVTNAGPNYAAAVAVSDTLPAGTTFVSLSSPAGWTCTTPAVGATGTVSCSIASLTLTSAAFTLTVDVDPALTDGTILTNTATVTSTTLDPVPGGESGKATTVVTNAADLSVTKSDAPDPASAGTNVTYTIAVANAGPSDSAGVSLTDAIPAGTTFVSLSSPGGWTCSTPAIGATGTVTCSISSVASGSSAQFTLVVAIDPSLSDGSSISNTAVAASTTTDPTPGNNSATVTTIVGAGSAALSITMTDSPDPVNAGNDLTWTINVVNAGPSNATSTSWSDALPAGTTFASLVAPAGWSCTTPAVGANGAVTCSIASFGVTNASFTLTALVDPTLPGGTLLSNDATVTSATTDPDTSDQTASSSTTVLAPASLTATKTVSGSFVPGGSVTYTITITNVGPTPASYAGEEILPPYLRLTSASSGSGTSTANPSTNAVAFSATLAAGASQTILVEAVINESVAAGTVVSNQATVRYDADGDGSNEATLLTDDAAVGGAADPTNFTVGAAAAVPAIPALDPRSLAILAALLALAGIVVSRR